MHSNSLVNGRRRVHESGAGRRASGVGRRTSSSGALSRPRPQTAVSPRWTSAVRGRPQRLWTSRRRRTSTRSVASRGTRTARGDIDRDPASHPARPPDTAEKVQASPGRASRCAECENAPPAAWTGRARGLLTAPTHDSAVSTGMAAVVLRTPAVGPVSGRRRSRADGSRRATEPGWGSYRYYSL